MWKKAELKDRRGSLFLPTPHPPTSSIPSAGQTLQAGGTLANVSEGFALNPVSLSSLPSIFPRLWEPGGKATSLFLLSTDQLRR